MNAIKSLIIAVAVLAVSSTLPTAQAARPDFSKLAGRYKSTYLLITGSTTIPGNVTVTVTVPQNGRKASIQIVGYGSLGSTTFAQLGNLRLTSRHKITADNILLAYFIQIPATNTNFKGSRNKLRFTLVNNSINGIMNYTLKFNGKHLTISGNGIADGFSTSVLLKGTKKGK